MKRLSLFIFIAALLSVYSLAKAQDTLYLDDNYKKISPKRAVYTKVVTNTDSSFLVKLYKRGSLVSIQRFKDEALKIQHGPATSYYENGNIDSEGSYKDKKRTGHWTFYYDNQKIASMVKFHEGKVLHAVYYNEEGNVELPSNQSDVMPVFQGDLKNYLKENLRYPHQSSRNRVSGIVKVAFTISRTGKVVDARVTSGVNDELDAEALRVIRKMPDWQPGRQFNRPVSVRYVLPIAFALNK